MNPRFHPTIVSIIQIEEKQKGEEKKLSCQYTQYITVKVAPSPLNALHYVKDGPGS